MMITCKEDLRKCYIPRCDNEAFELFMDKCEEFDIVWAGKPDNPRDCKLGEAVVFSGAEYDRLTHGRSTRMKQKGYKRLTLSDLNPEENMKSYKTYQECKIANLECEIYTDGVLFTAEIGTSLDTKCNPSDHCMTVKEFLDAGYRFEVGDIVLHRDDGVYKIEIFPSIWNEKSQDDEDELSYILRAAVLEAPKRTKVEYVECELTRKEFVCELIDGGTLYKESGKIKLYFDEFSGKLKGKNESGNSWDIVIDSGTYLRRIETEIDERQEFIDEYVFQRNEFAKQDTTDDFCEFLADSGKFKLVN